ncbi:ecdysteroid UDP-glucosyltransferase [Apocheima cinerarium nucleopolyhedrovirus]|uniref:ecdysteroid UDP-glucosyltransferase n=1 Tax=Apocheima cinerarium nucleopolyhedrovirus TaxID=307461 RepID=UPI0001D9203B|nr:ecdysteroid UDP-glucosyltransferase [Apocheima cinerarium nucleopolyhedrovirus]ADB84367.1 ecdysteroid UDP-glucosyltransferase [Apocheima cinerarium nucleopolyhedrovirus]
MYYILVLLLWLADQVHGARILAVFPTPSYSHQSVFKVYIEALASRGHDIVVVKPTTQIDYISPVDTMYNITQLDATLSEEYFKNLLKQSAVFKKRGVISDSSTVTARNYIKLVKMIQDQLDLPSVKDLIEKRHSESFDLLITEAFIDYPIVLSHLFGNVPVIQISSGYGLAENFETMGAVARHPVYYPNLWRDKFRDLNMWETINELYMELRLQNEFSLLAEEQNKMLKQQFGINTPTISNLKQNVKLLLINVHSIFDNNRPVPPSVQYLGGLHLHRKKVASLIDYVKEFLDKSVNGVIYVSFGSTIDTKELQSEFINMILNTFEKLPYSIAWKYDGSLSNYKIPNNVLIQSWFDQYSLLHHNNVKAFVTQGGVQSTDEAIESLVPLVGIPMMGDQAFNTNKYIDLGIGRVVDTLTVDSNEMAKVINDVATNNVYRQNLKELRHLIHNQPMTSEHKAIWYTEHVIKSTVNKNRRMAFDLKTEAANVSYSDYLMSYIFIPFVTDSSVNHVQQLLRMTFFAAV